MKKHIYIGSKEIKENEKINKKKRKIKCQKQLYMVKKKEKKKKKERIPTVESNLGRYSCFSKLRKIKKKIREIMIFYYK